MDRSALAAYCTAYSRWSMAERVLAKQVAESDPNTDAHPLVIETAGGNFVQNPIVGIANRAMRDMVRYAAEFGMTPSSRARFDIEPPPPEADPAAEFFDDPA